MPRYRSIIIPWLRWPGQRFLLHNWLAITIGPLIFSWRKLDEVELAHEVEHVRQWRKHGPMYIVRYLAASRAAVKAGGDSYVDNEFEVEARAAGEKVRRRLASS